MKVIVLLIIGVWLGMVIGISFLEAPLKFQAPGITVPLGLGIGKLVFTALNRFEILFSAVLVIGIYTQFNLLSRTQVILLGSIISLVMIQSIWLLPFLNERAEKVISGIAVPNSHHHFYYVAIECYKVIGLLFSFISIHKHG